MLFLPVNKTSTAQGQSNFWVPWTTVSPYLLLPVGLFAGRAAITSESQWSKNIMYTYTWMSTSTECSGTHHNASTHVMTHTLPLIRTLDILLPRGIPENQVLSRSPLSPTFLHRAINETLESETLAPKWLHLERWWHLTLTTRSRPCSIISAPTKPGVKVHLAWWLLCEIVLL